MFASQLLRILQTLPPDVNHETCAFETAELEAIMKEKQNGALCDLNNCENDAARLASVTNDKDGFCNTPELECTMVVKDSTNSNDYEVRGSVAPCTIPSSKMELFERDGDLYTDKNGNENEVRNENEFRGSVAPCTIPSSKMKVFEETFFYTDKNVLECELPELIVCYKENTYHVVKDICIDEGVPSKDKILIQREYGKGLCTTLPSKGNKNGDITDGEEIELLSSNGSKSSSENDYQEVDACEFGSKEEVEIELLISDALKSSSENDFEGDIGNDVGSLVSVQTGEANYNATDKIVDGVSREKSVTISMPSSRKFSEQKSLKSLFESPDCDSNEVEQQSAQIPCSEATCECPALVSSAEESNKSSPVNNLSYNSKVETATITFDFNSSKSAASGRDENPDDVDNEKPLKIDSGRRQEDGVSDSLAVASEIQHVGQGESSFTMAGPVSGLITYSGPIAYSGSVSLRSDSSTTSTRSFAFPILQAEWNSSPVRMAKADRRHYRRHRGWRQGLLCCRF